MIKIRDLKKEYITGEQSVLALHDVNLDILQGKMIVVVGASGAGKSTLLNILGGMDEATSGSIVIDGEDICQYSEKKRTEYRRHDIGFVFQFYNLVNHLTALENVELASQICKNPLDAKEVLISVGLKDRINHFPSQLSGGEQQRVAIARALAKNPKILLCDEPTGALDYKTGKHILETLQNTCIQHHMTVIIITHNSAICPIADQVIHVKNGTVEEVVYQEHPKQVGDIEW